VQKIFINLSIVFYNFSKKEGGFYLVKVQKELIFNDKEAKDNGNSVYKIDGTKFIVSHSYTQDCTIDELVSDIIVDKLKKTS
jgi:hypothetical protein